MRCGRSAGRRASGPWRLLTDAAMGELTGLDAVADHLAAAYTARYGLAAAPGTGPGRRNLFAATSVTGAFVESDGSPSFAARGHAGAGLAVFALGKDAAGDARPSSSTSSRTSFPQRPRRNASPPGSTRASPRTSRGAAWTPRAGSSRTYVRVGARDHAGRVYPERGVRPAGRCFRSRRSSPPPRGSSRTPARDATRRRRARCSCAGASATRRGPRRSGFF